MESISMANAIAARTKQRLDPNQELIGQGIANIGGSFFQSYPACGSFTGSAINLQAGAKTGFAMVFNGLFVATTLLFLTEHLYHLPKATVAVIILLDRPRVGLDQGKWITGRNVSAHAGLIRAW